MYVHTDIHTKRRYKARKQTLIGKGDEAAIIANKDKNIILIFVRHAKTSSHRLVACLLSSFNIYL